MRKRLIISLRGAVQGVGFRPFVARLAERFSITGWVQNSPYGVLIEAEGTPSSLEKFKVHLLKNAPPLALILDMEEEEISPSGEEDFTILESEQVGEKRVLIVPDISVCPDCLKELQTPTDPRYRYPFINCTNCGPRFTIIEDLPYDRELTTMRDFKMCNFCRSEYEDIKNRRYHAQPVACPQCGPKIFLKDGETHLVGEDALKRARQLLFEGKLLAVKGLGGFHLLCDCEDEDAVSRLRKIKHRPGKPLALMASSIDIIRRYCHVGLEDESILKDPSCPILLLERVENSPAAPSVAPGNRYLGVMLPYTPLHYLLLEDYPHAVVATSANIFEEPIIIDEEELEKTFADKIDAILYHNRRIKRRCDDSVVANFKGGPYPVRRSRGYAPLPIKLPRKFPPLLALGPHMKNTLCLLKDDLAFPSQHIGDLDSPQTRQFLIEQIQDLTHLFDIKPRILACDMHPGYFTTKLAEQLSSERALPLIKVQHHHAHIASCLAEHSIENEVIGVAFDGTGFGDDGAIWGGEFLLCSPAHYIRVAHIKYVPLPGGERAIRECWRMAFAYLYATFHNNWQDHIPLSLASYVPKAPLIDKLLRNPSFALSTSSCGRLFDGISALLGLITEARYEAEGAINLEAIAEKDVEKGYEFDYHEEGACLIIDPAPLIKELLSDINKGLSKNLLSGKFHKSIAQMISHVCLHIRKQTGIKYVALSGGVFQNMILLKDVNSLLEKEGFHVLIHRKVPPNDGGISLGQAYIAGWRSEKCA